MIFAVLFAGTVHHARGTDMPAASEARADLVVIDVLKQFGPLERPPVPFLHDRHTTAMEKQGKDCSACHLKDDNKMVLKFMRLKDESRQAVMDQYHADCMACHKQMAAKQLASGPVECGACHAETIPRSGRRPIQFDRSLHYRHSRAQNNKCETCHHEYNEKTKTLFYAKGKEGSCRYCHREETTENRIAMSLAAHTGCIECHARNIENRKKTGPIHCGGCHDPEAQRLYEIVMDPPRIDRKQPDRVFVTKGKMAETGRMKRVPFDHKAHEVYNQTCIRCHHKEISACSSCHSLTGAKEGEWITLEKAMHGINSDQSCLGCHSAEQQGTECAGCHAFIDAATKTKAETCSNCHLQPLPQEGTAPTPDQDAAAAAALLAVRVPVKETLADAEVPEKVVIKRLAKKFEPVVLPHRKIVHALMEGIRENQLAAYFHKEKETICQGCHHNSPASKKSPACANCHGRPFEEQDMFKPGLMGAYHIQCMECHKRMGLKKPVGCTECHKEK